MYERLSALIVEPNASKRGYLWQATLHEPQFYRVKGLKSLEETLVFLGSNVSDVLLISSCFPKSKVASFVEQARTLSGGREAAYVTVVPAEEQTKENIALNLMDGLDGFLFIPFSVSSLKEVAKIAGRVKKKFEGEKKKAALKLLLPDLSKAVDNFAVSRMIKSNLEIEMKENLLEAFGAVKNIAIEFRGDYIDILTEFLESAPPRTLPAYRGASERVKQMYEKTLKKV